MDVKDFFQKLKQHCELNAENDNEDCSAYNYGVCEQCCFRKFCFTPPINLSEEIVSRALENLEGVRQ